LLADVEWHHSNPHYVIDNFRTASDQEGPLLPTLKIKRKKGKWVHLDTERESQLSEAVGLAIDLFERNRKTR
jgi:hypothetical protein